MRDAISVVLILTILLIGPNMSWGAGADATDGRYRLGEIVVSGVAESSAESAGTLHRITAQDIENQGARTLDDALQLVPGVTIREGAEGTPRVDIRGFRTRHVQLFLNGIPVKDTFDGQFDPTRIPAGIISEIKVTTGGGSVLYGPGGNGGAIDIITKGGKKGIHGAIAGEAGEGERYVGKGSFSYGGDRADIYTSITVVDRDKFKLANTFKETNEQDGQWRDNSDRKRTNLFGNLGYQLTDSTRIGITVSHLNGENGKPPVTNFDNNDPFTKRTKYERIDDLLASLAQIGFTHQTQGPIDIRGWVFFSQSEIEENRYDDDTYTTQSANRAYHQDSSTKTQGISTQISYRIGDTGDVTLGLNAENNRWDSDGFNVTNSGSQTFSDDRDLQIYATALEYEQALGERIQFVLGYGHYFQEREESKSDDDFSYLAGVTFDMTRSTRLRLNHARKVRFPSIKQLYDGSSGNTELDTEITRHYEVGVQQHLPAGTTLGITAFIIHAEDFIEKDASDVNRNFENLNFSGLEAILTLSPVDQLMLRLSVGWLDTEDVSDDSDREELQYRPGQTVIIEGRYQFRFGLTAYASLKYVADQYFYDADNSDPLEKQKLDDFSVVKIKLRQQILHTGLEIYAGVENLFDENYSWSYGFPQPGRTIYAGVEYRF